MKLLMESWRRFINEQEEQAQQGFAQITPDTNIGAVKAAELWRQLVSGQESPLYNAMKNATGWASGVLGTPQQVKQRFEQIGEEAFSTRVQQVQRLISAAKTAKFNMPALEGGDADAVVDALSDAEGSLGVDLSSKFANQIESFAAWWEALPEPIKQMYEAGNIPSIEQLQQTTQQTPQQNVSEDKFPRFGKGPMPGAPAVGEKEQINLKNIKGAALAFLTKGMLDGAPGDAVAVKKDASATNSKMIPTQSNILAAKSLLFAYNNPAKQLKDMGGAFVTNDGKILDGHHRWSGALIGTGGALEHTGVHIVQAPAEAVIPLLVTVGNALGRQQKGPSPDEDENQ